VSYAYLGKRGPVTGTADTSGLNAGNWTIAFTPAVLVSQVPELLVYKIQCSGALGATFNVYVENQLWDTNIFGTQNSWYDDAGDSLVVRPGETLSLCYSDPVSDNTPPVATIYLRYDYSKFGSRFTNG
jgi:hypothetical protein